MRQGTDSNLIEQYYADNDEEKRLIKQNITRIEFDTTVHVLDSYINKNAFITELGAATGRYALYFAAQGHFITAIELVQNLVDILRQKAKEQNLQLDIYQGNAQSIPFIADETQDIVLILGPLHNLLSPG